MEVEINENNPEIKTENAEAVEEVTKKATLKKRRLPLVLLFVGIGVLMAGSTLLILKFVLKPGMRDAEYLVQMGEWRREDNDSVIWNFTEIGKGTLTTNNHQNDYEFLWSIDGDTLKIETKWLYDLNDEFTYKLQQDSKTLVLSIKTESGEESTNINFRATGRVDTEVTEDN